MCLSLSFAQMVTKYKGITVTQDWWNLAKFEEKSLVAATPTLCASLCRQNEECKFFSVDDGTTCQLGKSDIYAADTPIGPDRVVYTVPTVCQGASGNYYVFLQECMQYSSIDIQLFRWDLPKHTNSGGWDISARHLQRRCRSWLDICGRMWSWMGKPKLLEWSKPVCNMYNRPICVNSAELVAPMRSFSVSGEDDSFLVLDLGCCMLVSKATIKNSHNYIGYSRYGNSDMIW